MNAPDLPPLQRLIARPPSPEVCLLASQLAQAQCCGACPLMHGISPASFAVMCATTLPGVCLDNGHTATPAGAHFDRLYALLMTHAAPADRMAKWLAAAIATAALRDGPLWQALGLPSAAALKAVLQRRFPELVPDALPTALAPGRQ